MADVVMPDVDPAVAARAAELAQRTEPYDPGAQFGRDQQGRPNVPGFTSNEPMVAGAMENRDPAPTQADLDAPVPGDVPNQFQSDVSGIEDLLTEEELDDEIEDTPPPAIVDEEEDEYEPDASKKAREKLTRERDFYKERWLDQGRKNWRAEAKRRFPLADVEGLNADTRKGLLRTAKEQHERIYATVKPYLTNVNDERTRVIEEEKVAARARAAEAYGKPFQGPTETAIEHASQAENEDALDRRHFKTLQDRTRALVRSGKLQI